ncbi:Uncharacterised protein [Serratia plymuthica]|uniref:Uncharacterized protein n=1 Tax=Serratia plymuthica S13 TaxID=1348660 RepID=S4YQB8_SERPL|nr:hypothetical protein M621_05195 [Serratia plymuthica S13]KYG14684.1 hypothetical protein SOD10_43960 [Serratia plymuthica]CAI0862493.1 Uncharacterised protein [Serratia plymuthica]
MGSAKWIFQYFVLSLMSGVVKATKLLIIKKETDP